MNLKKKWRKPSIWPGQYSCYWEGSFCTFDLFWCKVSYSPGWPQDTDSPVSISQMLVLQACLVVRTTEDWTQGFMHAGKHYSNWATPLTPLVLLSHWQCTQSIHFLPRKGKIIPSTYLFTNWKTTIPALLLLNTFIYLLTYLVCTYMSICVGMLIPWCSSVRGQLVDIISRLPPCGSQISNSGSQAWQ